MIELLLTAQSVQPQVDTENRTGSLFAAALFISFLVFLWLVLRRSHSRYKPLQDRSMVHMDRLEAKSDEMIALLREIRDKLSRPG